MSEAPIQQREKLKDPEEHTKKFLENNTEKQRVDSFEEIEENQYSEVKKNK